MKEYIKRNYYTIKRSIILSQLVILIIGVCVEEKYILLNLVTLSILSLLFLIIMNRKYNPRK